MFLSTNIYGAILGGILIGISSVLLLLYLGRVAGISGIFSFLVTSKIKQAKAWQFAFIAGLVLAGLSASFFLDTQDQIRQGFPLSLLIVAGLLVGYGTQLGSGCTSGHGICGISRGSTRSMASTLIFMATAVITVFITNAIG